MNMDAVLICHFIVSLYFGTIAIIFEYVPYAYGDLSEFE
jgi:hypothetical protein